MSKKEKMLKGIKTPSRRKFFKVAAATGAAAAASVAMPNIAFWSSYDFKDANSLDKRRYIISKWLVTLQKWL